MVHFYLPRLQPEVRAEMRSMHHDIQVQAKTHLEAHFRSSRGNPRDMLNSLNQTLKTWKKIGQKQYE